MGSYFHGTDVWDSHVVRSEATTFKDFIQRHLDSPVVLNRTYQQYHDLSEEDQKRAKLVSYLVAARYPTSPCDRKGGNVNGFDLVFLDIDTAPDGSSPALELMDNPAKFKEAFGPIAYAAWRTVSSTPEKPRCRVLVSCSGFSTQDYAFVAREIAYRLGLPAVTQESLIVNQPMFSPVLFKGQSPDTEHPVFCSNAMGRPLTPEDLSEESRSLPTYNRKGGTSSPKSSTTASSDEDGFDAFLSLATPVPSVTPQVVNEMLLHMDPEMGMHDWLDVMAALHHQFGGTDQFEEVYDIFDRWSQKSVSKYPGHAKMRRRWETFKPIPDGRAPVTARTLIKMAKEYGWTPENVRKESAETFASVLASKRHTRAAELVDAAIKAMAQSEFLTSSEEGSMLAQLIKTAKQRFGETIPLTSLRQDLKKERNKLSATRISDSIKEPNWARGFCYVGSAKAFYRRSNAQLLKPEAFDAFYGRELLPTPEMLLGAGREVTQAALSVPFYRPQDFVLNHIKCPCVDDFVYDPTEPKSTYVKQEGKDFVNVYKADFIAADSSQMEEASQIFLTHLSLLIPEPEYQTTLLDWIAHNVQYPGKKIRWMPLIQGAKGCGKTFFFEVMACLLGPSNSKLITNESIKKGWTEWAYGSQVIAVEEIYVSHDRGDLLDVLKPLITNDYISIEKRANDTRTVRNVTNYMAFSNYSAPVPTTDDERRFWFVKCALQTASQVKDLGEDYFTRLFSSVDHMPGALRSFFEAWTISPDFNPDGRAPVTHYFEDLVRDSASDTVATVRQIISDGDHPLVQNDLVSSDALKRLLEFENPRGRPVTKQYLNSVLSAENYVRLPTKFRHDDQRHIFWHRQGTLLGQNLNKVVHDRLNGEITTTETISWD